MGWACIGTGAVVESTTTSITLAEPAGTLDGDLLVACFAQRSTATTPITGTGWNASYNQNNNNVVSNATTSVGSAVMLYRVRSGTPTLTFTIPAGNSVTYGRIMAYRGNTATPADFTNGATTATNVTALSVTGISTSTADELLVAIIGSGRNSTMSGFAAATAPTGASGATVASGAVSATTWTERADSGSNTTPRGALGIFDAVKSTAGASGNLTCTMATAGGHAVVSASFKMAPVTGINVFSGSAGVEKPVKVWSGTGWVPKQAKFWTGTQWKNVGVGRAWSGVPGTYSPEAEQFFARVSGLTDTRKVIYDTYIKALVSAGVWAKLHWHYKTNAPTRDTAVTNLKSASFKGTIYGSPIFAVDGGMAGRVSGGTSPDYIDTGYNPFVSGSQNDAHLSVMSVVNAAGQNGALIGCLSSTIYTHIYPKYTNGNIYGRINDVAATASAGPANPDASGFIVATRNGANTQKLYDAGVDTGMASAVSGTQPNFNMYLLAQNNAGAVDGSSWICKSGSAGTHLTAAEVTAFKTAQEVFDAAVEAERASLPLYFDGLLISGAGGAANFTYPPIAFITPGTVLLSVTFPAESTTLSLTVNGTEATQLTVASVDRYSHIVRFEVTTPGLYNIIVTPASVVNYCILSTMTLHGVATPQTGMTSNIIPSADPSLYQSIAVPAGGIGIAFLNRPGIAPGLINTIVWTGCDSATSDMAASIGGASLPGSAINRRFGGGSGVTFNPTVTGAGTYSYSWNYLIAWGP